MSRRTGPSQRDSQAASARVRVVATVAGGGGGVSKGGGSDGAVPLVGLRDTTRRGF